MDKVILQVRSGCVDPVSFPEGIIIEVRDFDEMKLFRYIMKSGLMRCSDMKPLRGKPI